MKYKLSDLQYNKLQYAIVDEKKIVIRPENTSSFRERLAQAWAVICGSLDTLDWSNAKR